MLPGIIVVLLFFSSLHVCRALPPSPPASDTPSSLPSAPAAPRVSATGLVRSVDRLYRGGGRAGFLLDMDGRRFQLDLERDESAPTALERSPGRVRVRPRCAYRGTVDSNPESLAAFELCGGRLRGFFAVDGARYTVRALPRSSVYFYRREGFRFEAARGADAHDSCGTRDADISANNGEQQSVVHVRTKGKGRKLRRHGRSVSRARHVELLLVADESMARKYGTELRHYLLTLASIASRLYGHASIENPVRLSVVKVTMLTEKEKGLEVSRNAAATLKSFCKWQNQQNPLDDDHEHHHDAAILFTRQVKS